MSGASSATVRSEPIARWCSSDVMPPILPSPRAGPPPQTRVACATALSVEDRRAAGRERGDAGPALEVVGARGDRRRLRVELVGEGGPVARVEQLLDPAEGHARAGRQLDPHRLRL